MSKLTTASGKQRGYKNAAENITFHVHISSTGSQDSPGNNPSSSTSRQDSLHKAWKKNGIKSSISHLFHKKEKGWPEHPGKEALGPGRIFTPSATWKAPVNADN